MTEQILGTTNASQEPVNGKSDFESVKCNFMCGQTFQLARSGKDFICD